MTFDEQAYRAREKAIFERDMLYPEKGTRREQLKAAKQWLAACQSDVTLVAERVAWLLDGNYGKGSYDAAWEAVDSKFIKSTTRLLDIIAALEWLVARRDRLVYARKLTPEQHLALTTAIEQVVHEALETRE